MNKVFLTLYSLSFFLLFFPKTAFALTDISLQDDKEKQTVSIFIDSNEENIPGVDISIMFSEDIVIEEVSKGEYCTLLFDYYTSSNKISIECFNASEIPMDKAIANIKYSTQSSNYSFYIEESTLDLGVAEIGKINNINKDRISEESENDFQDIVNQKYLLPLLGFFITILLLVLINKQFRKNEGKKKGPNREEEDN